MKCYNKLNAVNHFKINTINVAYKYNARKDVL